MFLDQIEAAIAVASPSSLVELNRTIWAGLSSGAVSEEDAGRLAELIHARQAVAKVASGSKAAPARPNTLFQPRRPQRSPDRAKSIERRRTLAATGVMPPALACRFTTSELAVLRVVADEAMRHGSCRLFLDAIAARAGVSRSTAKNALREARLLGLLKVDERPQHGAKNLSNVVTIVDKSWLAWLRRGPGIGVKKIAPTVTDSHSAWSEADRARQNRERRSRFERGADTRQKRQSPA